MVTGAVVERNRKSQYCTIEQSTRFGLTLRLASGYVTTSKVRQQGRRDLYAIAGKGQKPHNNAIAPLPQRRAERTSHQYILHRFCGANYANRLWRRTILLHIYRLTTLAPPRLITPQSKKSKWFKCLKSISQSRSKTRTKHDRPTERLQSDYGSELQSRKVDKWLTHQGIVFESSAPYSQGRKRGI